MEATPGFVVPFPNHDTLSFNWGTRGGKVLISKSKYWIAGICLGIFIIGLIPLVVLLAGVNLNINESRSLITNLVSQRLGRAVRIQGPIQLEISLKPAVHIEDIALANPANWPQRNMATIDLLSARLSLLPLLKKQLYIHHMRLEGFRLKLELLEEGKNNWQFNDTPAESGKKRVAKQEKDNPLQDNSSPDPEASDSRQEENLSVPSKVFWNGIQYNLTIEEHMQIKDFVIQYFNHPAGATIDWQLARFDASMPDHETLVVKAEGRMLKEPYHLELSAQITTLLSGLPGNLEIKVKVAEMDLDIKGQIDPSAGRASLLEIVCQVPDSDILERLLGDRPRSLAPLSMKASLEAVPGKLDIPSFVLETAQSRLEGSLYLDNRQRTSIRGKVEMDSFDLGPWMTPSQIQSGEPEKIIEKKPTGKNPAEKDSASQKAKEKNGSDLKPEDNSEDHPPLARIADHWLRRADIDVSLGLGRLMGTGYEMKDLNFSLKVEEGKLQTPVSAVIEDIRFGGTMRGQVEDECLSLRMGLMARRSPMDKLIRHIPMLEGAKGELGGTSLTLESRGNDLKELVRDARLKFTFKDSHLILPSGNLLAIHEAVIIGQTTEPLQMGLKGLLLDIPVAISAQTTAPSQLLLGKRWQFSFNLDSTPFTLNLEGVLPAGKWQQGAAMDVSARSRELGTLAPWLGVRADAKGGFELEGRLEQGGDLLTMDFHKITLAGSSGQVLLQAPIPGGKQGRHLLVDGHIRKLELSELLDLWPQASESEPLAHEASKERSPRVDSKTGPQDSRSRKELVRERKEARNKEQTEIEARLSIPILPEGGFSLADSDLNLQVDQVMFNGHLFEDFHFKGLVWEGWLKKAPFGVRFNLIDIKGDMSLDLRTPPYSLNFSAGAQNIDVGELLTRLNIIEDGEIQLDQADFSLSLSGHSLGNLIENARLSAELGTGYWDLKDINTGATGRISLDNGKLWASPGQPLSLELAGQLKEHPFSLKLSSLPLEKFVRQPRSLPLEMQLSLATVNLAAKARVLRPLNLGRAQLDISLEAPRLDALDGLHGLSLPPYGPIRLGGTFKADRRGYHLEKMKFLVGKSALLGSASLGTDQERPFLDLALKATNIQLDDFRLKEWGGWSEPERQKEAGELLYDNEKADPEPLLSPMTMRRLDAKFTLDVDQVRSGQDWLGAGKLHWHLKEGHLCLDPLSLKLPGGDIHLTAGLSPQEKGFSCFLKADIENFDYGILARHIKPETNMQGLFSFHADLESRTDRPEDILKHASGTLGFGVWPREFEAGIFDLWAVSLATAVLPELDQGNRSVFNCVVGIFKAKDGELDQDILLADTSRMRVIGQTELNFNTEKISMRLTPQAKRAQIFSLETPIQVSGSFEDFKIGVVKGGLIGTTVRFITSPVIAPMRWIFEAPLEKDGSNLCRQVWDKGIH